MKNSYIILGSPGSGKTNQAILLADKLNLSHISWGKISRKEEFNLNAPPDNKKKGIINCQNH